MTGFSLIKTLILTLVILAILAGGGYLGWQNYVLKQQKLGLEAEKATLLSKIDERQKNIDALIQEIATTTAAKDELAKKYGDEKSRAENAELILNSTKDTVNVLVNLKATDPELLKKYSKVYFLNENYVPQKLSPIDPKYIDPSKKELLFHDRVLPHLEKMMADAYATSTDIKILSTYRSYKTQGELKYNYTMIYGSGANKFSADQGYSEHQLGTALDFTTSKMRQSLTTSFDKTPAYKWLTENAHKYGFILSYPRNNGFYQFEPWHWRYIGIDFATRLHDEGKVFYDLDQRLIDTYLIGLFD